VIKRRKNFFPTLFLAILFWLGWGWLVYFTAPTSNVLLIAFCVLLFIAVFLAAALIFANSRRGLIAAFFVILFLLFRHYQVGNLLNLLLLLAIFIALELYFSQHQG